MVRGELRQFPLRRLPLERAVSRTAGFAAWGGRFGRFLGVGAFATGLQYALLVLGCEVLAVDPVAASAVGFVVSAVANYWLNYHFSFRSSRRHRSAAGRFALVAGAGLALNTLLMQTLAEHLGLQYLLAQVLTTAVVLIWNFFANALWSFARPTS